jgi:hyperosmotically inducible protein
MEVIRNHLFTVLICVFFLVLTSCQQNDAAITGKIKQEIISDSLLKVSEIEVTTTDGVVKLSGAVNSQTSLDRVVEMAGSVKDVKSVETGLVVKRY